LYQAARSRQAWIEAARDISTNLLGGEEPEAVHRQIVDQASKLTGSAFSALLLPDDADGLVVTASTKPDLVGKRLAIPDSTSGTAYVRRIPLRVKDFDELSDGGSEALVLPLRESDSVSGAVVCVADAGCSFTEEQLDMMSGFADQAALALQLAKSRANAVSTLRELDVLTDRDRIARDLHDHVI